MLNCLELELEIVGEWHIGVIVNNDFLFYTTSNTIYIPLKKYPAEIQIVFTGKNYNNPQHADNYCKIKELYLNQLNFQYLIQQSELCSDNPEYKVITACDYINLNGVWKIIINQNTAEKQLRQLV